MLLVRFVLSILLMLAVLVIAVPLLQRTLSPSAPPEPPPWRRLLDRFTGRDAPAPDSSPATTEPGVMYKWRAPDGTVHIESYAPTGVPTVEVIPFERTLPGASGPGAGSADGTGSPAAPGGEAGDRAGGALGEQLPDSFDEIIERVGETLERLDERDRTLEDLERQL